MTRNLRELYYELRCLDCGSDGMNRGFRLGVATQGVVGVDGDGKFDDSLPEGISVEITRRYWDTLTCAACASTNVQRKRRYRQVQA